MLIFPSVELKKSEGKCWLASLEICDKSQKTICTSCWWYWIAMLYKERRPSQFYKIFSMVTSHVTNTP